MFRNRLILNASPSWMITVQCAQVKGENAIWTLIATQALALRQAVE